MPSSKSEVIPDGKPAALSFFDNVSFTSARDGAFKITG
jgi:hypothetical protein